MTPRFLNRKVQPMPPTEENAAYVPRILGVLNVSPESMVSESIAEGADAVAARAGHPARTGAARASARDLGGAEAAERATLRLAAYSSTDSHCGPGTGHLPLRVRMRME